MLAEGKSKAIIPHETGLDLMTPLEGKPKNTLTI